MKKSFTLLPFCFLFLLLGFSSCKKDYLCYCEFESQGIDDYSITLNDTKRKAETRCYEQKFATPTVEVNCHIVN